MDYWQQRQVHKQLLLSSTLRFTQGFFQYMNGAPYIVGEHHVKICQYLDKVVKGEIQKLIINIAPRFGKCISPDMLVYTKEGLVCAKNIKAGDFLYSYKDGKKVEARCKATGVAYKQSVVITMRSGRKFTCSYDHPMLTPFGYIEASDLEEGDGVFAVNEYGLNGDGDFYTDSVVSVNHVGPMQLVDIEVAVTHNFIANGLVSHNTELVSRMFPAYGFALNPKSLFLHLSYSGSLTLDNSVATKDIIMSKYFQNVFKVEFDRRINSGSKWNTTEGGGEYATSMLGQITGFGAGRVELDYDKDEEKNFDDFTARYNPNGFAGAIIIDDPIKPEEALSDKIREKVNLRFETTIRNRVNSRKTPIIIIMQRLHEHDLCGYLQEVEPEEWTVLSLPAIMTDGHGNQRPLWPFKLNIDDLMKIKNANSYVFETQYMQNPTPMEGLMYRPFKTYEMLPPRHVAKFKGCVTDPADTGADWLCSICFDVHTDGYYVTDVLYTKKPVEYTEQALAQMLCKNETGVCFIEGNNGGRLFMRNVERITREYENRKTRFVPFSTTKNKQVRIFSRANEVCNMLVFPADWQRRWPEFYRDLTSYRKEGVMSHDDAADCATMVVERCEEWNGAASDSDLMRDFL